MAIMRVSKNTENPFVMVDKQFINNPVLSMKAKGLLCYLLSKPDNWQVYVSELVNNFSDGKHALNSTIRELQEAGHIERVQIRNDDGKFRGYEYYVYERPAETRKPDYGKPVYGKSTPTNIDNTKKDSNNNEYEDIKTIFSKIGCDYSQYISNAIKYYFHKYKILNEKDHPFISRERLLDVAERMSEQAWPVDMIKEDWQGTIDAYFDAFFDRDYCDCNILHFAAGKNMEICYNRFLTTG